MAAASGLCAVAVVGWLWLTPDSDKNPAGNRYLGYLGENGSRSGEAGSQDKPASPFAVSSASSASEADVVAGVEAEGRLTGDPGEPVGQPTAPASLTAIDVSQLARTIIGDEEFDAIVAQLRTEPALLQRLIDEFRQEQDPDRRHQLMKLLGHAGGADVTLLASELVYSGDESSRELGLQMLQRAQPGSAEVQQIASQLLATEVEPRILVSTLATLARPGTVDNENRTLLADQVAVMAAHPDAGVRGVSLDILSRLSTDGRDTPVLLAGLADSSERVREAAAYALVGHEEDSVTVRSSLWEMLRDTEQSIPPRSAAIMALRSQTLSEEEKRELELVERRLNANRRRLQ